ncbi:MAG: MFS transporter [Solirubrobacterales bacterium]
MSQFFLTMVDDLGESVTFWPFAVLCLFALIFVWLRVPETRDRTLEEIEQTWHPADS